MRNRHLAAFLIVIGLGTGLAPVAAATAGPLENLERERAAMLAVLRDPGLAPEDRQLRLEAMARRLRDLEQMAMRDETLLGRNTPTVRQAFAHYELTFLVHAAAEAGHSLAEHWLTTVGLGTDQLLAARVGRR